MNNEDILNLWDCNKLTCGEVIEAARADEKNRIIEILNQCSFEVPYENSAFGYGIKLVDHSKVMNLIKENTK